MLLADYASDSDAGSDAETPLPLSSKPTPPGPKAINPAVVTAPKPKKRGPVKITLDQPKPFMFEDDDGTGHVDRDGDGDGRDAKRPKVEGLKGGGRGGYVETPLKSRTKAEWLRSSLLGMLPPPKRKLPVPVVDRAKSLAVNKSMAAKAKPTQADGDDEDEVPSGMLLPSSIARGKAKAAAKAEAGPVDLFGLCKSMYPFNTVASPEPLVASAPSPNSTTKPTDPIPSSSRTTISSAPSIPDTRPPSPSRQDPYPGYYQTPSGDWKAYDPGYYHSFFPDTPAAAIKEKGQDGRVGKHWDEYDTRGGEMVDIDVAAGLEEARKEQERLERMKKPKGAADAYEYKVRSSLTPQIPVRD